MPKVTDLPKGLKPYAFHGVDLGEVKGEDAAADCPFCGREGKFTVNAETGLYRCWVCTGGEGDKHGGNPTVFVRRLYGLAREDRGDGFRESIEALALDRALDPETLEAWGLCRSPFGGWVLPGYSPDGSLNNLYRYVKTRTRTYLNSTPTLDHQLFGINVADPKADRVYICEGPWDGMALWEALGAYRVDLGDDGEDGGGHRLVPTSSVERSLRAGAAVIAVPSCSIFKPSWAGYFAGKRVYILFDNDHPRTNPKTGAAVEPAGLEGVKRVTRALSGSDSPPAEIHYLEWGPDGYEPQMKSGWDVRDHLQHWGTATRGPRRTAEALNDLLGRIRPTRSEWWESPGSKRPADRKRPGSELECVPCRTYRELTTAWRKAMRWTDGLDKALAVMLASVASVRSVGDQLWVKVMGPASCGKSTLCEALSVNRKYVIAKSSIRGFHSGYGEEDEDVSLINKLSGMTLVTKDGDTLLQSPTFKLILAEARDIYDTTSRTDYRNKKSRDYEGVRMTWILCGTSSLRSLDQSELGERFLDCTIMDGIDDDLEDEILWRVANRTARNMAVEANGKAETLYDPDLARAMQLTGGYIDHLRNNATELLSQVVNGEESMRYCVALGKFVAYMRARPSVYQGETAEREFAARLVSQHIRLANCLAVVLNRTSLDDVVLNRVRQVALDTARGQTLALARYLYNPPSGGPGAESKALAIWTKNDPHTTGRLLRFLHQIGAAEPYHPESGVKGVRSSIRWRLSDRLYALYETVMKYDPDNSVAAR